MMLYLDDHKVSSDSSLDVASKELLVPMMKIWHFRGLFKHSAKVEDLLKHAMEYVETSADGDLVGDNKWIRIRKWRYVFKQLLAARLVARFLCSGYTPWWSPEELNIATRVYETPGAIEGL